MQESLHSDTSYECHPFSLPTSIQTLIHPLRTTSTNRLVLLPVLLPRNPHPLLQRLHRPLLTTPELHHRPRIPQLRKLLLAQPLPRRKYRLALHVAQLRHPAPDVLAIRVALFGLDDRVKDGEVGLPALRVVAKVPIDEVLGEVALPFAVVDEEVGAEVGGGVHAGTVVHVCL